MKKQFNTIIVFFVALTFLVGCGTKNMSSASQNNNQDSKKSEEKRISLDAVNKISTFNQDDQECFSTDESHLELLKTILSDITYKEKFEDNIEGGITINAYTNNKLVYSITFTGEVFIIDGDIYKVNNNISDDFNKLITLLKNSDKK